MQPIALAMIYREGGLPSQHQVPGAADCTEGRGNTEVAFAKVQ